MNNINVEDNFNSPKVRGERLRRLRNMANLSREELCNTEALNVTTYKGWEIGRFGGISASGAKEVIARVAKEGVACSLDWLLDNRGRGPFAIANTSSISKDDDDNAAVILQEIAVFQNNFKEGIFLEITDDGIEPLYNAGDYVAGIKKYGEKINSLIGQICIVQTINNKTLIRQLLKGTTNSTYTLVCTNPKTSVEPLVLFDININAAASIIRYYKKHK